VSAKSLQCWSASEGRPGAARVGTAAVFVSGCPNLDVARTFAQHDDGARRSRADDAHLGR